MEINLENIDKDCLNAIANNSRYSNKLILTMLSTIIVNINLINKDITTINNKLDLLEHH
jgi:hypothetical protein